jgi:hypothetical protein
MTSICALAIFYFLREKDDTDKDNSTKKMILKSDDERQ